MKEKFLNSYNELSIKSNHSNKNSKDQEGGKRERRGKLEKPNSSKINVMIHLIYI